MYIACFKAKEENDREFDISYWVTEENKDYCIECSVDGGNRKRVAFLGSCGPDAAERLAHFFAANALRPAHLEEVVSDMRF